MAASLKNGSTAVHGLCLVLQHSLIKKNRVELQYHTQPVDWCGAVCGRKRPCLNPFKGSATLPNQNGGIRYKEMYLPATSGHSKYLGLYSFCGFAIIPTSPAQEPHLELYRYLFIYTGLHQSRVPTIFSIPSLPPEDSANAARLLYSTGILQPI